MATIINRHHKAPKSFKKDKVSLLIQLHKSSLWFECNKSRKSASFKWIMGLKIRKWEIFRQGEKRLFFNDSTPEGNMRRNPNYSVTSGNASAKESILTFSSTRSSFCFISQHVAKLHFCPWVPHLLCLREHVKKQRKFWSWTQLFAAVTRTIHSFVSEIKRELVGRSCGQILGRHLF